MAAEFDESIGAGICCLYTHCPILNMNEKKTKQVPIQLPNIARTLFDAKRIIKKKLFPWTSEIIQFIQFKNNMDGPRYLKKNWDMPLSI